MMALIRTSSFTGPAKTHQSFKRGAVKVCGEQAGKHSRTRDDERPPRPPDMQIGVGRKRP